MNFRYAEYKAFLRHISARFSLTTFSEWDGSNAILLRHDVDFDLAAALRLAVIEHECAVPATYFVMTTSTSYSPMTAANRRRLRDIANMGFEIGLHFDPSVYESDSEAELQRRVDLEAAILESIIDRKIRSVSLHNPSIFQKYVLFPNYINAYDPRIFSPEVYLSDSRMVFSSDVLEFAERSNRSPVQILLHPLHFTEEGDTYPEIISRLAVEIVNEIDKTLGVNSTYAQLMKGDLLSYIAARLQERSR